MVVATTSFIDEYYSIMMLQLSLVKELTSVVKTNSSSINKAKAFSAMILSLNSK